MKVDNNDIVKGRESYPEDNNKDDNPDVVGLPNGANNAIYGLLD
jgi:hypothetical protein